MSTHIQFNQNDFAVFAIPGLNARMEALKAEIRPKLEAIGEVITPYLSASLGAEFTPHVAKHARRSVNPPDETWVAWSTNKRGYKSLPHFQVGLRENELFILFALIYEYPYKANFAQSLQKEDSLWQSLPNHFVVSNDHTKPDTTPLEELDFTAMEQRLERLTRIKKEEFLCGVVIPATDTRIQDEEQLLSLIESTFAALSPLYELALRVPST
ncbi:YktB family protein [Mechercharimyces sp. CAU 1602]|uniref:YktB family protein n=1 Tax=Mechercharimyces sp. CAU 1602 TaxID=2973933 RepID=UPI002163498D|nr:DUF1054 domain-containing protein [Mechercharimyces sp. CAU 1602]MCS1350573.1 DUF1054 domain-containing protein [Mechercharimyces sp. CAU 1602]